MNNTVDITNLSDAVLDAILDVRSGVDFVDASKLTVAERHAVAEALDWEMNSTTRYWIEDSYAAPTGRRGVEVGRDFEKMILEDQDADESRWT